MDSIIYYGLLNGFSANKTLANLESGFFYNHASFSVGNITLIYGLFVLLFEVIVKFYYLIIYYNYYILLVYYNY